MDTKSQSRKNFGVRLKLARTGMGLIMKEVAEQVGVSLGTYAKYERGVMFPSLEKMVALCNVLDVRMDFLLADSLTFLDEFSLEQKIFML